MLKMLKYKAFFLSSMVNLLTYYFILLILYSLFNAILSKKD